MTSKDKESDPYFCLVVQNNSLKEKIKGLNINEKTMLSTDYLNHFNEVVMMIGMVADMPEVIEDCKEWHPKSYIEHFAGTSLSYKDTAIEVYKYVPEPTRLAFEKLVGQIDNMILQAIEKLEAACSNNDQMYLEQKTNSALASIQKMTETASAIIHGSDKTLLQEEIDQLMNF